MLLENQKPELWLKFKYNLGRVVCARVTTTLLGNQMQKRMHIDRQFLSDNAPFRSVSYKRSRKIYRKDHNVSSWIEGQGRFE